MVAGSRAMTGAARLVARAAMRAGAGYVVVALPASILPVVQASLTEAVFLPLPETDAGSIAPEAVDAVVSAAGDAHAVAIGPGLTRHPATASFVREVVRISPVPLVVDADALNAFEADATSLADRKVEAVLTPARGRAGPPARARALRRSARRRAGPRGADARRRAREGHPYGRRRARRDRAREPDRFDRARDRGDRRRPDRRDRRPARPGRRAVRRRLGGCLPPWARRARRRRPHGRRHGRRRRRRPPARCDRARGGRRDDRDALPADDRRGRPRRDPAQRGRAQASRRRADGRGQGRTRTATGRSRSPARRSRAARRGAASRWSRRASSSGPPGSRRRSSCCRSSHRARRPSRSRTG